MVQEVAEYCLAVGGILHRIENVVVPEHIDIEQRRDLLIRVFLLRYRNRRYSNSTASAYASDQPSPDSACMSFTLIGSRSSAAIGAKSLFELMSAGFLKISWVNDSPPRGATALGRGINRYDADQMIGQ